MGGRRVDLEKVRDEFATWLTIDQRTKRKVGLPTSIQQFADLKQVSDRTLRRWKNDDPEFAELVAQREAASVGYSSGGAVADVARARPSSSSKRRPEAPGVAASADATARQVAADAGIDDPELLDYASVKAAVTEGAGDGDGQMLAAYMKYWGHEYAARERESRESSFADLSDDELIAETLTLIGEPAVRAWLDR